MYSRELLSAVAGLGLVSGAAALGCSDDPVTLSSPGDVTVAAACTTIKNNLVIEAGAGTSVDLSGKLTEIQGDFIVKNNTAIQTLSSSSLETIGGTWDLEMLEALSSISFTALNEVQAIEWLHLTNLGSPDFGSTGIKKADSVWISDTRIPTIDGINVDSLTDLKIDNNLRLTQFTSSIKSLSNVMNINSNGLNLSMTLPNLVWAANLTIANVSSFSSPSLETINGSLYFDFSYFEKFEVANLTEVKSGAVSFIGCPYVQNISFPVLKSIGGGLTIANNTDLLKLDGFGKLADIGGAIIVRGSFDEIDLPSLDNVVGTATFVSDGNIEDSCDDLNSLGTSIIQGGVTTCKSNDSLANNSTGSSTDGDSGSDSSGSGTGAAGFTSASMTTVFTLAALAGVFAAFL
ncbi:GPI-anchored cell wall organization protein ecm33 [Xylariaceae sp. FL1019]|nr:GPI-anchored cell wall organization protein ecm33 [Xylariaceae sp. FL1019]